MNFLKYQAKLLRDKLVPARARIQDIERIESLQLEAAKVKDLLIQANMRLVTSIAKRHAAQSDNFFELLSDGNMSLIRAVEKFDFGRGNKLSTCARSASPRSGCGSSTSASGTSCGGLPGSRTCTCREQAGGPRRARAGRACACPALFYFGAAHPHWALSDVEQGQRNKRGQATPRNLCESFTHAAAARPSCHSSV
jgi:hypothetical protein